MNTPMSMTASEAKRDLTAFEEAMERLEKSLLVIEEVTEKAARIRSTLVGPDPSQEGVQSADGPRPTPLTYEQRLNDFANRLRETTAELHSHVQEISRF